MATIVSHALVAITMGKLAYPRARHQQRVCLWAAVLSMLPDLDVFTFPFGIPYGHFFGHRGFSHSLAFALMASVLLVATEFRDSERFSGKWWRLVAFFFTVTASHGVLDAMTSGGLGIAFFSPFENSRYFLPWTPLQVSPIGRDFFSEEGFEVLLNEALWIGLPCAALLTVRYALDAHRSLIQ